MSKTKTYNFSADGLAGYELESVVYATIRSTPEIEQIEDQEEQARAAFKLFIKRSIPSIFWCSGCGKENVLKGQIRTYTNNVSVIHSQGKWYCKDCAAPVILNLDLELVQSEPGSYLCKEIKK